MRIKLFLCTFLFSSFLSMGCYADSTGFPAWLDDLRIEARKKGVSEKTIENALGDIEYVERIIELDRKQPEGTITFAKYRENVVNANRISKGRKLLKEHSKELWAVSEKYGVPPRFIVALWGIETNFGGFTGGHDVVEALATLAYDGRRSEFFRDELFHALKILDEGHIDHANMKGSWAGAMGQSQFMPSSFQRFAVDFDGDGRRDIWTTHADVFGSAANYLAQNGWRPSETWGREVQLPAGFDKALIEKKTKKSLAEWAKMGVKKADGRDLPVADLKGYIMAPEKDNTAPYYIVYNNYETVLRWNRSNYFGTSVGLLADEIGRP